MTILIVAAEAPLPANTGFRLRNLHLARQLARADAVTFAHLGSGEPAPGEAFEVVMLPGGRSRVASLAGSLGRPYMAARHASPAMCDLAAGGSWSSVQAESPFTMPAALCAGSSVVLDAHNVEAALPRTLAAADDRFPQRLRRLRWRWEAAKTERFERAMVVAAAAVCATSDSEAATFESWGARRVVLVPNGVDVGAITYQAPDPAGHRLVYVGSFGYLPNQVAAVDLVDRVLPAVAAQIPGASVRLVGRDPGPALRRRAGPRVEVTGTVDDVVPLLRDARALVVPLRAGGGTRLKVLEAMAAGLPVVSTPFGVAGLPVTDGEHVLLGDTASDLAAAAVRLMGDDGLARHLSTCSRRLVEARFDWSVVAGPLVDLHRSLGSGR